MEPTNDSSPIKKFLEKRGSGLHHIALETPNIEGEVSRMEGCGIQFLGKIRDGSAGTKVNIHSSKIYDGSFNGAMFKWIVVVGVQNTVMEKHTKNVNN